MLGVPGFSAGAGSAPAAFEWPASVSDGLGAGVSGGGCAPALGRLPAQPPSSIAQHITMTISKAGFAARFTSGPGQEVPSFRTLRAAPRASSHPAASVSFSETSRRNCAVRFSVSGASSSSTKRRSRVNSSSSRCPIS